MSKYSVGVFFFLISFAGFINNAYAEQAEGSLEAHVHGLSELTIAMENDAVEIQLTSPAMNLVGFEHRATSKKDIAAVENAESILRKHKALFSFSGSVCKHLETAVDVSTLIDINDHHYESHKDEHHHESQKGEHHHGHKDHGEAESHSEIVAKYKFSCRDASKLSSIEVALFDYFRGIHEIHAMWVVHSQQGSKELTANNTVVQFR